MILFTFFRAGPNQKRDSSMTFSTRPRRQNSFVQWFFGQTSVRLRSRFSSDSTFEHSASNLALRLRISALPNCEESVNEHLRRSNPLYGRELASTALLIASASVPRFFQ